MPGKNQNILSQMVVKDGHESHGIQIRKNITNKNNFKWQSVDPSLEEFAHDECWGPINLQEKQLIIKSLLLP